MKNYSIMTTVVQLPMQVVLDKPLPVFISLPDNAIPLQLEYRSGISGTSHGLAIHYLVPSDAKGNPLCGLCNTNPAEFEGIICMECKKKQDEIDLQEERKTMAEDMVKTNHKDEKCWIDPTYTCKVGLCSGCEIFLEWKGKYNV